MQAIQYAQTGDMSVVKLCEVDKPAVKPGTALVKLKAAGMNFIDIYQRAGRYPVPMPYIPGFEKCVLICCCFVFLPCAVIANHECFSHGVAISLVL